MTSATARYLLTTSLSVGMSFFLLAMLLKAFAGATGAELLPMLLRALRGVSLPLVGCYVLAAVAQTLFRALRYRVILDTSETRVPGVSHLFIVSMVRNMFVDLLPARLGELSFLAMLNRGYRMRADSCLAALSISFVFDLVALGLLLIALMGYQVWQQSLQPWLIGVVLVLSCLCVVGLLLLFPLMRGLAGVLGRSSLSTRPYLGRLVGLIVATAGSLHAAAQAGIAGRVVLLSLGVRVCKYLGLYLLFLAVVLPGFSSIRSEFSSVLISLVSAEASASLPVPAFMSFGSYEAGGALALIALGADKTASLIIMLALHLWSQLIDYGLGLTAMIAFLLLVLPRPGTETQRGPGWKTWSFSAVILLMGLLLLVVQVRGLKKMGGLTPPVTGQSVAATVSGPDFQGLKGFVVWSSNRFGNHDILRMSLPDRRITRLTTHPHAEYFPRISPDGRFLVFARSHVPYVSQRNALAWSVVLLALDTGKERVLAEQGNVPTWSDDGSAVRYQRQGNQFVEYDLASGRETVLMQSGQTIAVAESVLLETPVFSDRRRQLAVTFRGGLRGTYLVDQNGTPRQVGGGCELAWSPDSSYLYYVDHGGRMKNRIYRVDPTTLKATPWFDATSEYSHEYFPRVANTGAYLIYGASAGGHEHDRADYEIFLWRIGSAASEAMRLTYHTGNDNWPDIFLQQEAQ